eukprot:SAG22_NODE_395_length_11139_cov_14.562500_5_plen_290_part_00
MRNALRYRLIAIAEAVIMGSKVRDVPGHFSFRDTRVTQWKPSPSTIASRTSGGSAWSACPVQPGLYYAQNVVSKGARGDIKAFVKAACEGGQRSTWHAYDPGRLVAPVLLENDAATLDTLREFEVFGEVEPEQWLRLDEFAGSRVPTAVCRGAQALAALPATLRSLPDTNVVPSDEPHDGSDSPAGNVRAILRHELDSCTFLQLQQLQRGASVRPHIDAAVPPAELVATVGLTGTATVRVGAVELQVEAGDVYCITGPARWEVKHEVLASTRDRLTVTLRFSPGKFRAI